MTHSSSGTDAMEQTRTPLVVDSIRVIRAPGISPGFALENLSPDINIVYGPNASGKSTTARAIQSVLWPHRSSLRGHHLAASFSMNGEQWQIDATAANVQRSKNGSPAEAPQIAPLDDRGRYSLGLPELLASENQPLAQAIMNESSGGFDLPMVAESLGMVDSIPPRLEAANEVQRHKAALRDVAATEARIDSATEQRGQLLQRLAKTYAAERDIDAINTALEYQRQRAEVGQIESEVNGFAANVRAFTGEEPAAIAKLDQQIADTSAEIQKAEKQRDRWQQAMADAGIKPGASIEDKIKSLKQVASQTDEIDEISADVGRQLATATTERTAHQNRIAADINDEQIALLDASGVRELAEIASSYERIRSRRNARDEVEIWLGGIQPPENLDALQLGVDTLEQRLQHPNAAEQREVSGMSRLVGVGGGLLLAGAGVYLGITSNPLWWILAVVGVILMLLAWKFTSSSSPQIAADLERTYANLPLPQPEVWRTSNVRDLLDTVRSELNTALVEQEKADRWQDLEHERAELDKAHAETETRREAALAKYGVAPDLKEESLRLLADNLSRWQGADATVRGLEARQQRLDEDRTTLQARSRTILNAFGLESGELDQHISEIERRSAAFEDAREKHESTEQHISDSLQPRLETLTQKKAALYADMNLKPDDIAGVHELRSRKAQLVQVQARLAERQEAAKSLRESLNTSPQFRDMSGEELNAALDTARQIAQQRPELEGQLREIERIEQSGIHLQDYEHAQASLDGARSHLADERDRIMSNCVGHLLLSTVQQETRDAALPIVFHRARELFAIITRGKYELQFEATTPPEFTALDSSTGMTLSLDQLSSGTRVQLLMAIRLAFVENVEIGPKLPIILDETLGNSDEFRASAIIDAAIDISQRGRQVFYFTAQGEEVARWQQRVEALPEDERPQVRLIELTEVRKDARFERLPIPAPETTEPVALPSPADYDNETWAAAIRIPNVDPWASSLGSMHVWHVLPEAELAHELLQSDITTWGQLRSLKRSNPERLEKIHPAIVDSLGTASLRAELIRNAVQMWRIGRAHPMPSGILAEAEMVDAVALGELQALQEKAGNDAQKLLDTLQTMDDPPLAEKPLEALELWLISEGYIAQGTRMSEDDIRARIISLASPAIRAGQLGTEDIESIMSLVRSW